MANTYKPVIERDMSVYQKAPLPWAPGTQALTYDVRSDQDVPAVTADPAMYDQYAQLVQKAYENLRRAGREQDASALKNAADRFSATGADLGLNSFSRAAALRTLQNQMNISANMREAGLSQQEVQALSAATAGKASQSAQAFQQAMARAQFREDKLASMKQDEMANSQLRLQQKALKMSIPRRLPTPSLAGSKIAGMQRRMPAQAPLVQTFQQKGIGSSLSGIGQRPAHPWEFNRRTGSLMTGGVGTGGSTGYRPDLQNAYKANIARRRMLI